MRKISLLLFLFLPALLLKATAQDNDANLGIIPAPKSLKTVAGNISVNNKTILEANNEEAKKIAEFFSDFLQKNYSLDVEVKTGKSSGQTANVIQFDINNGATPKEGYELNISPDNNSGLLKAGDGAGLFHGLQSLMQMTFAANMMNTSQEVAVKIPGAMIDDAPRFPYRGMHLDVGRHFFSVKEVKKLLDLMAYLKFNTFHWHLTEDQGWRIQIKKYPKLTEVGSRRNQTVVGHNSPDYDGQPYGGFYTQDEIKEVVKYAQERYITIIPEIEMPGHSLAALTAYPWLGCTGGPYKVAQKWGVFDDIYCAGKDSTFQFLENVLTEVMQLFPSHYIHIGGDEAPKTQWKHDPRDQALMKKLGLKNENELQSYFIQRIEKFLNAHGRAIIGWDEILEGGLAPNATVMSWRGEEGGIAAAKQHHDVIMTPGAWCYFDKGQSHSPYEPLNIGGYLSLSKVYGYNPVPSELSPAEQKYIIGAQANLWTEYIASPAHLEYMIFPRLLAMAEVDWTPLDKKDYNNFEQRLPYVLAKFDQEHVHFRIPEPEGLADTTNLNGNNNVVTLKPLVPGTQIYYTLDGSYPTMHSTVYTKPISLPTNQNTTLNLIERTPNGNTSVMYSGYYKK